MSPIAHFFLRPRVNLSMAAVSVVSEVVSWFTTFDDAYRVTPIAFVLTVIFVGLFAIHEHVSAETLRAAAKPTLRLMFGAGHIYDSIHPHNDKLRIIRVGVQGSGESVHNVAVKVARVHPELPQIVPMQELQQTHTAEGVSKFTVNQSTEPLVFVNVIRQYLRSDDGVSSGSVGGVEYRKPFKKGETFRMTFALAAGERDFDPPHAHPADDYLAQYLIWLAIDGGGAEASKKFVLQRNERGQYDMSEAWPQ